MGARSRDRRGRALTATGLALVVPVLGLAVIAAAALALDGYRRGFRYGGDSPAFVLGLLAGLVACGTATLLLREREPRVARWLAATTAALVIYLLATATAVQYAGLAGRRDALAWTAVLLHSTGHILPIVLLELSFVVAVQRLAGRNHLRPGLALLSYSAAYQVFEAVTRSADPPYQGMGVLWPAANVPLATVPTSIPWMAVVIAGPILVWRAVARTGGLDRRRALLVAVLSVVPVATILFCVLSAVLVYGLHLLPVAVGEAGLGLAFGFAFLVCGAGMAAAFGTALPSWLTPVRASRVMSVAVGLSFAIVIVSVSAAVGSQVGAGGPLPVAVGTFVVAAVLTPLRRRLVRIMLLRADPGRAAAATLVQNAVSDPTPGPTAERILRTAVGDPAARLVLGLPDGSWVDVHGNELAAPRTGPGATALGHGDAYLLHSSAVVDAAGPLEEVRLLVDHAVLTAAVRDQTARLSAERDRADEAATAERRRLERDLHDGVQGRLLALALDLRMAQRDLGDASAQLVLSDAAAALSSAIDELRALAAGEAPELLSRRGLGPALTELTGRMPVPITVRTPPDRLPPDTETVAYLVACEGITNAVKHAAASWIQVEVSAADGIATVVVSDDGGGGADPRAGTGLRGLAERVGGAGGTLVVSDRRPTGTVLEVTLPCDR